MLRRQVGVLRSGTMISALHAKTATITVSWSLRRALTSAMVSPTPPCASPSPSPSPSVMTEKSPSISSFNSLTTQTTVIRDSRSLAMAMVKFIPDGEVDAYTAMLQTMRERPETRPLVVKKLLGEISSAKLSEELTQHNTQAQREGEREGLEKSAPSLSPTTSSKREKERDSPRSRTHWVDQWLLKALHNKRVNLFPLRLPAHLTTFTRSPSAMAGIADFDAYAAEQERHSLLRAKARLAAYLFASRQLIDSSFKDFLLSAEDRERETARERETETASPSLSPTAQRAVQPSRFEEKMYIDASRVADELGDALHTDKLHSLTRLVRRHMQGELGNDALLAALAQQLPLHLDRCQALLDFLSVPLTPVIAQLVQSRRQRREAAIQALYAELSYVVCQHNLVTAAPHERERETLRSVQDLAPLSPQQGRNGSKIDPLGTSSSSSSSSSSSLSRREREGVRAKLGFGKTHLFEMSVRCFAKSRAPRFAVDLQTNEQFQSSLESSLSSSAVSLSEREKEREKERERAYGSLEEDADYDLLVKSVASAEIDDLELLQLSDNSRSNASNAGNGSNGSGGVSLAAPLSSPLSHTATCASANVLSHSLSHSGEKEKSEDEDEELLVHTYASPARKILIDNIPHGITETDLANALRKCGAVRRVFLYAPSTETPSNQAALQEVRPAADQVANGSLLDTLQIRVPGATAASTTTEEEETESSVSLSVAEKKKNKKKSVKESESESETLSLILSPGEDEESEGESKAETEKMRKIKKHKKNFKRKLGKEIVLKGTRTDNYAFVVMEDDEGFAKVCSEAIRIFGININGQLCKTYRVDNFTSFRVEVRESMTVRELNQALSVALDGEFECYHLNHRIPESIRPLYINLSFNDHRETWKAFHTVQRAANTEDFSFLAPSWIRSQRYFKMGLKAKQSIEQEYSNREIQMHRADSEESEEGERTRVEEHDDDPEEEDVFEGIQAIEEEEEIDEDLLLDFSKK